MFGYVNVYKDELKIKEYNLFRAYYCGLCKALGKRFNQLVRLGLNYDFTFLAIMTDALTEDEAEFALEGCIKNISKKKIAVNNDAINFSADMSILLTYYKLLDDIRDDKSIKAFFAAIPYRMAIGKLKNKYSSLPASVSENLKKLSVIEKEGTSYPDEAAHPFALIMQSMFEYVSPGAGKLGYNIGRYVYFSDALDDIKKDYDKKRFNVFCNAYNYKGIPDENIKKQIEDTMYMTLGNIGYEYEKLPRFKNREILNNIIYMGIRAKTDSLLESFMKQTERKKDK